MRFGGLIYLELHHDGFTARNLARANAHLATEDDPAAFPPADIAAAFGHERLIMADFRKAERLLFRMFRRLTTRDFVKPVVIVRVQHRFAETVTLVELMALLDSIERAGARRQYLWFGRALSDEEVLLRRFPSDGIAFCRSDFAELTRKDRER